MRKWDSYSIGDIAQVFDGPHATPEKTKHGPWFLSISSLDGGRLNLTESAHLSEEDFVRWTRRVTPEPGDVLFSYETRLGEAALVPEGVRACLGRRMGLLRPNRKLIDPNFLLFSYLSPDFQATIQSRKIHGATVDRIPLVDLPKWSICLPDLTEQRAIATALRVLDDKIVVNECIAATALELARCIYNSFTAGAYICLGLGKLVTFKYGKALRAPDRREGATPVYGCTGQVGWHDESLTPGPTPVVGRKGANAGRVSWSPKPCWVIDTAFFVEVIADFLSPEIAFLMLETVNLPGFVGDSAVPGLNREVVHSLLVNVPEPETATKVSERVRPLLARAIQAEQESGALAVLRDTLLPRLMSGKLRVRDAERIVEDAV